MYATKRLQSIYSLKQMGCSPGHTVYTLCLPSKTSLPKQSQGKCEPNYYWISADLEAPISLRAWSQRSVSSCARISQNSQGTQKGLEIKFKKKDQLLFFQNFREWRPHVSQIPCFIGPALRKAKQVDLWEFKSCLVYTVNSRAARSS